MTTDPIDGGRPARFAPSFRPGPTRDDDRRVAVASIALATAFVTLAGIAGAATALGAATTPWLPVHLALAGGASTAIAGVMPFFAAALSAGHPAPARLRVAAVALVAVGALLVSVRGIAPQITWLPALGGIVYLSGIGAIALALRGAGRGGLMVRRPIVVIGYAAALGNVAVGASLGILAAAGWLPVLERWGALRPAHAWTNVIGFVSVVIVATLLHFLPTVLGTRIVPRRAAIVAVLAMAMGSPFVVVGLAAGWPAVAAAGVVLTLIGVGALVLETARIVRARGRWTTDPGWHLVAEGGLVAGVAWFSVGAVLASGRVLASGVRLASDGWSTQLVGVPLALGWVVQVLLASWTHLLPSIGPGGPPEHARQRQILGRGAAPRLVALNAGTALLAIGWTAGSDPLAGIGLALAVLSVGSSVGLALLALRVRVLSAPPR